MENEYVSHIVPYRLWVRPVLPLVYDDALSYLETLGQVVTKLNEVIEWANDYKDELYNYVDQKAQENLNNLLSQLNQYKSEVNAQIEQQNIRIGNVESSLNNILTTVNSIIAQFQSDLEKQMANFRLEYQTDINQFKNQVNTQLENQDAKIAAELLKTTAYVNAQISLLTSLVNIKADESKAYTDQEIQKILDSIPEIGSVNVIYPGNNQLMSIQDALNKIFYDLSFFTLTAEEYDNLDLTAENYDNFNDGGLTAEQYDRYGKNYFYPTSNANNNIYSSSEQQIGIWGINTKRYRKVFTGNIPAHNINTTTTLVLTLPDTSGLYNVTVYGFLTTPNSSTIIPGFGNDCVYGVRYAEEVQIIAISLNTSVASVPATNYKLIVEYTKEDT